MSCEHDMANGTCSQCDPYVVQNLRGELERTHAVLNAVLKERDALQRRFPVPMILTCPTCRTRHIDEGIYATKPHHTHACQACGLCWRPAVVDTVGVQFLPGFKNAATDSNGNETEEK